LQPDILFGFIAVGMTVLGGIVSAHAPTDLKHKAGYIVAFVALGCWAWVVVVQQSKQATRQETELRDQIKRLETASSEVTRLQGLNNQLQQQLLDLGKTNAALGRKSIMTVTGGDSYCWMDFLFQFGRPVPVFVHSGAYPLYDLVVRVADLNKERLKDLRHEPVSVADDVYVDIGALQVGRSWYNTGTVIPFSDERSQDFNVFFSARNGGWIELLRLRKVKDNWLSAVRIEPEPMAGVPEVLRKPIFERVPKDFPKNEKGQVDW
jgi:hypothetical protein